MQSTVREHKDGVGGAFSRYKVLEIQKIGNKRLWERYVHRRKEVSAASHWSGSRPSAS